MQYDVAVIGSGPAGVSASIYAKRGGLNVVMLSDFTGALTRAEKIENYYGFPNEISGKELFLNGIHQAEKLGVDVIKCQVTSVMQEGELSFTLKHTIGQTRAKCVVIACGSPSVRPKITGLDLFEGRGVSYCAVCDGFFFREKSVCVLGTGEYASEEVEYLLGLTSRVTVLTDGINRYSKMPSAAAINTLKISEIQGKSRVERVVFEDGSFLPTDGVFVAGGTAGASDFALRLGLETNEKGAIITDQNGCTNLKGVFAAGDCTTGVKQIYHAVSSGSSAGMAIIKLLKTSK